MTVVMPVCRSDFLLRLNRNTFAASTISRRRCQAAFWRCTSCARNSQGAFGIPHDLPKVWESCPALRAVEKIAILYMKLASPVQRVQQLTSLASASLLQKPFVQTIKRAHRDTFAACSHCDFTGCQFVQGALIINYKPQAYISPTYGESQGPSLFTLKGYKTALTSQVKKMKPGACKLPSARNR